MGLHKKESSFLRWRRSKRIFPIWLKNVAMHGSRINGRCNSNAAFGQVAV